MSCYTSVITNFYLMKEGPIRALLFCDISMLSEYYRALVLKDSIWLVTGFFRSAEGYVLERTLDGTGDVLEFFVTDSCVEEFEEIMTFFVQQNIVFWYKKMPNRLVYEGLLEAED